VHRCRAEKPYPSEIYATTERFGTLLENVDLGGVAGQPRDIVFLHLRRVAPRCG
jgi:hypothetical protein